MINFTLKQLQTIRNEVSDPKIINIINENIKIKESLVNDIIATFPNTISIYKNFAENEYRIVSKGKIDVKKMTEIQRRYNIYFAPYLNIDKEEFWMYSYFHKIYDVKEV